MNCTTCQNELEDFLYGELDGARAQTLRTHLRNCAACAQVQAALEREQQVFLQYHEQTAPAPSDALWQAIHARIQTATPARYAEPKANWWQRLFGEAVWLRQAAFAGALVLASVAATTLYFKWRHQPAQPDMARYGQMPAVQPSPMATPGVPLPVVGPVAPKTTAPRQPQPRPKLTEDQLLQNQLARAEREYQHAIKMLDRVIARHQDKLDPAVRQQYESSLALIDSSIAESRRALRTEPANVVSGQFLLAAYAKKLDLMRDIAMNAGQ